MLYNFMTDLKLISVSKDVERILVSVGAINRTDPRLQRSERQIEGQSTRHIMQHQATSDDDSSDWD